jgi:ankyrin repeat protein
MIFIFVYNNEQHGNSALHEAAWRGYSQTVTILTQQKANVNAVNRAGFTPLHLCCQNGHNETCRVLLWADANPDAKNHVILFTIHSPFHFSKNNRYVINLIFYLLDRLVWRHAVAHQRSLRSRGSHAHPGQRPVQRLRAEQGNFFLFSILIFKF